MKRICSVFSFMVTVILVIMISGCSYHIGQVRKASKDKDLAAKSISLPDDKAMLYVIRDEGISVIGKGRPVYLNNTEIGRMGNNQYVYSVVDSGIYLLTPFEGVPLKVSISPGQVLYYRMKVSALMSGSDASELIPLSSEAGAALLAEKRLSSKCFSEISVTPLNVDSLCSVIGLLEPGMPMVECPAVLGSNLVMLTKKKGWLSIALSNTLTQTTKSVLNASERMPDGEIADAARKLKASWDLSELAPKDTSSIGAQLQKQQKEFDKTGDFCICTLSGPSRLGIYLYFMKPKEKNAEYLFISSESILCNN